MPYIRHKSGSYYLRLAIPKSLQAQFSRTEVSHPLQASNALQAKAQALSLVSQLLVHFGELQEAMKQHQEPSLSSILEKMENGEGKKYEITLPNGTKIKTNGTEDHKQALESIEHLKQAGAFNQPQQTPKQVLQDLVGIKRVLLEKAVNEFVEKKEAEKNKSLDHIENGIYHFKDFIISKYGNVHVHKINKDDLKEYRTELENLVTPLSRQDDKKLSVSTVLSRLNFIENFFRFCQEQSYFYDGEKRLPTYGNKPDKYDAVEGETSYEAFTEEELKRIFNPLHYKVLNDEPHKFWASLLGVFMGPRRGELVALKLHNINNNNPEKIWTIYFTEKVKNKNSRRIVPIHPALIEAGFLDYVEDVKSIFGEKSVLFPYSKNPGKMLGDCFARYLDRLNIIDKRKVFHSFRKNVAQCTVTVFPNYAEHYIGHLPFKIHNHIYSGREYPLAFYQDLIKAVNYQFLDFSKIKYEKGSFLPYLKRENIVLNRFNREGVVMPDSTRGPRGPRKKKS